MQKFTVKFLKIFKKPYKFTYKSIKMDKNLHQQLYSAMPRHSLGGSTAGLRTRPSSASSFNTTGRKSLGGAALSYAAAGMKKPVGGGSIGQR